VEGLGTLVTLESETERNGTSRFFFSATPTLSSYSKGKQNKKKAAFFLN